MRVIISASWWLSISTIHLPRTNFGEITGLVAFIFPLFHLKKPTKFFICRMKMRKIWKRKKSFKEAEKALLIFFFSYWVRDDNCWYFYRESVRIVLSGSNLSFMLSEDMTLIFDWWWLLFLLLPVQCILNRLMTLFSKIIVFLSKIWKISWSIHLSFNQWYLLIFVRHYLKESK